MCQSHKEWFYILNILYANSVVSFGSEQHQNGRCDKASEALYLLNVAMQIALI